MRRLTNGQLRALRWAGYPLLALMTFLLAAWYSFPTERVREKAEEVLGETHDVTIGEIERGLVPGRFYARNLIFKTRPEKPGEKPAVIVVDEIELDVSILSLLTGTISVDIEAALGAGSVTGAMSFSSDEIEVELSTKQLSLAGLPGLSVLFAGLPVDGGLNAKIALSMPADKKVNGKPVMWGAANGKITLSCPMCTVGPGKVTPKMDEDKRRTSAAIYAEAGVTLPKLDLGDNKIVIAFEKGRGEIKQFEAVSMHGELYGEGYLELGDPFGSSQVHQCFKFKFSDKAKQKNAKLEGMERGMEKARREDGYIGMRMSGTFDKPHRIGSRACIPGQSPAEIRRAAQRERRARRREQQKERERERANRTPPTAVMTGNGTVNEDDRPDTAVPPDDNGAIKIDRAPGTRGGPDVPTPRTSGPPLDGRKDDVAVDPSRAETLKRADEGDDEEDADDDAPDDGDEGAEDEDGPDADEDDEDVPEENEGEQ